MAQFLWLWEWNEMEDAVRICRLELPGITEERCNMSAYIYFGGSCSDKNQ